MTQRLGFVIVLLVDDACPAAQGMAAGGALSMTSFSAVNALSAQQWLHSAPVSDDPTTAAAIHELNLHTPILGVFPYDHAHVLGFRASQLVRLDGSQELQYDYASRGGAGLTRKFVEDLYNDVLSTWVSPEKYAAMQSFRNNSANGNVSLHLQQVTVSYATAAPMLQVIREVQTYTFSTFVSDLGGFLNVLAVILLFLFPLRFKPTQERIFLAHWLLLKWIHRHDHKQAQQQPQQQQEHKPLQSIHHLASEAEMAPSDVAANGQSSLQLQSAHPHSYAPSSQSQRSLSVLRQSLLDGAEP
jgi:hypothetical protein